MSRKRSPEELRDALLELGHDTAARAKSKIDARADADEIRALVEVFDADQKAATIEAMREAQRAVAIGLAGFVEGYKSASAKPS
jgi:hypothetical protein